MALPASIRITDVGPRDGLLNESVIIPAEQKVALIDALSASGVAEIEVSSFVSPRWVPQLADAAEVFAGITRRSSVVYSALVPNETGMAAALEAGFGIQTRSGLHCAPGAHRALGTFPEGACRISLGSTSTQEDVEAALAALAALARNVSLR